MRNDLLEIANGLALLNARITLVTNGSLLAKYKPKDLGRCFDQINISLHTLDDDKHFEISGKRGHVDVVADNIRKIRRANQHLPIHLNTVILKGVNDSISALADLIEFAKNTNTLLKLIELLEAPHAHDRSKKLDVYNSNKRTYDILHELGYIPKVDDNTKSRKNEWYSIATRHMIRVDRITCAQAQINPTSNHECIKSYSITITPVCN